MRKFRIQLKTFAILLSCIIFSGWIDPASDNNEEGVRLYNEEKYDEAISRFSDAQSHMPESQALNFNIANTHFKEGKLPEAEKSFKDVVKTEDRLLKAKANYNLGNTMYKQQKFKESLDYYKKAIQLSEEKGNLEDEDAASLREDSKYNYEFVQKKMEEMEKEQQEEQEQEQEEQEKDEQEQQEEQQQNQEEQDPQEEQEEHDKQQEENNSDQQEQEEEQKGQQENQDEKEEEEEEEQEKDSPQENETGEPPPSKPYEKKEMTKEEAERLLDTLKQAEMNARHSQEKEQAAHYSIEKDW